METQLLIVQEMKMVNNGMAQELMITLDEEQKMINSFIKKIGTSS